MSDQAVADPEPAVDVEVDGDDATNPIEEVPAVATRSASPGTKILALWLPMAARRRLLDSEVDLVETIDDAPQLVIASTRGPEARLDTIKEYVRAGIPVAVVSHPGGESAARQLVAMGAVTVVAEGFEARAIRVVTGETDEQLVDTYRTDLEGPNDGTPTSIDPVTGLPGRKHLEGRLAQLGADGGIPRLMLTELIGTEAFAGLGPVGAGALRRRLANDIVAVVDHRRCEVFDLGGGSFAIVSPDLPLIEASEVAEGITNLASAFAPVGKPIRMAVGSAGPECGVDIAGLMSITQRALAEARSEEPPYRDAADLGGHSAGAIELATALALADAVDEFDPAGPHSARVSDLAGRIARQVGLSPAQAATVGLAARLHDIGKLRFHGAGFDEAAGDHATCRVEHASSGEAYVRPGGGVELADMIAMHHAHWDGSGIPEGVAGEQIPLGARIIAVADRIDRLFPSLDAATDVGSALEPLAGTVLDPDLVRAALELF
jgi:hypothetical protein